MKYFLGLGNPGDKYKDNRHNVGHFIIENIEKSPLLKGSIFKKSDHFMNDSGKFVKKCTEKYKIDLNDLVIIHDDLDLKLGDFKIQFAKGPKAHNGIDSIDDELNTNGYWRLRVGVDARLSEDRIKGVEYVLEDFKESEKEIILKIIPEICKKLAIL